MSNEENIRMGYALGQRDAFASVLPETKGKIKLPGLARWYEARYGEKHFSHDWHTSV